MERSEPGQERRVERVLEIGEATHIACGDTFTAVANSGKCFINAASDFMNDI